MSVREQLILESRELYLDLWGDGVRNTHSCLYHAVALQGLLAIRGVRTMLQAGSCQWPMCLPEEDDGVRATHFSYQWEPGNPESLDSMLQGQLPEMHVWLAQRPGSLGPRGVADYVVEDTIIDPTAGTWPERARVAGHAWTSPEPPRFLWHTLTELRWLSDNKFSLGIRYEAIIEACMVADEMAGREIYPTISGTLGFGRTK